MNIYIHENFPLYGIKDSSRKPEIVLHYPEFTVPKNLKCRGEKKKRDKGEKHQKGTERDRDRQRN